MNLNKLAMLQWSDSTINQDQWNQLSTIIDHLDPDQKIWLSGYLAAQSVNISENSTPPLATKTQTESLLTILFGSQTGNCESIAYQLQKQAEATGLKTEILSMADFSAKQLAKISFLNIIVSTHGEGEAPDDAEQFYDQLFGNKVPSLNHLKYSVLALGDSSYELFCQTGKEIDERLLQLGANNLNKRVDCDVDFEADAAQWVDEVIEEFKTAINSEPLNHQQSNNITALPLQNNATNHHTHSFNRNSPFVSEILNIQKITGRGSDKNTFHIELSIDPEVMQYQPGDSLGIIASNDNRTVDQLLLHWQETGDGLFEFKGQSTNLRSLLTSQVEITQISKPFVKYLASQIDNSQLELLASSHQQFEAYCKNHQLLDLLQKFDPESIVPVQLILDKLKGITPRLYSIASAQSVFEDEVHLTVNLENATNSGLSGLASGYLCQNSKIGDSVPVYIESNNNFNLPDNSDTAIIMIGPGTGVAPFRSFMQQRKDLQTNGDNWLFFGNPHFSTDFLYQAEWLKLQKVGILTRLDVAFSRDQSQKIYVQNKLKDHANEVWQWLENGAYLYLCGDAKRMAKDVEQTVLNIIEEQGNLSTQDATEYLKTLKRANRYQKDVY